MVCPREVAVKALTHMHETLQSHLRSNAERGGAALPQTGGLHGGGQCDRSVTGIAVASLAHEPGPNGAIIPSARADVLDEKSSKNHTELLILPSKQMCPDMDASHRTSSKALSEGNFATTLVNAVEFGTYRSVQRGY